MKETTSDQENELQQVSVSTSPRRSAIQGLRVVEAERQRAKKAEELKKQEEVAAWLAEQCVRWSRAKEAGENV